MTTRPSAPCRVRAGPFVLCGMLLAWSWALSTPVRAQDLALRLYSPADGLPAGRVLSVLQDHVGYLWFGTTAGLARYDGSQFRIYDQGQGLSGRVVVALAEDGQGRLLVGFDGGGVDRLGESGFSVLAGPGMTGIAVRSILRTSSGDVWVVSSARLLRLRGGRIERVSLPAQITGGGLYTLFEDSRGVIWLGGQEGLYRLDGAPRHVAVPGAPGIRVILEGPSGSLWLGTDRGLFRQRDIDFVSVPVPGDHVPAVLSGMQAEDGSLWFGTDRGAVHVRSGLVRVITPANGLADRRVNAVRVDREGNVWFGTDAGADKLVASGFVTYRASHGLPDSYIDALARDREGRIWVGTRDGLAVIPAAGKAPQSIARLRGDRITALSSGRRGLWVTTDHSLALWREDGQLQPQRLGPEFTRRFVRAVLEDTDAVWLGTDRGLYRRTPGGTRAVGLVAGVQAQVNDLARGAEGRVWVATQRHGVWVGDATGFRLADAELANVGVWALSSGSDGVVWAATNGFGAVRFNRDGTFVRLTRAGNGVASDYVQQVLVDGSGRVWLYTNRGLDRWDPRIGITHYDLSDGLPAMTGSPGAAVADRQGRVWFGTAVGLVVYVDDEDRGVVDVPPVTVVQEVIAGGQPVQADQLEALSHRRRDVTIAYTALTFRQEAGTLFQYRLRGYSDTWSRLTAQRRISYLRLPPGEYRFEVLAINDRGVWSREPATVSFRIVPALWQRRPVHVGLGLIALLVVVWVSRRRLRQVEQERRTLRQMVDKRTRELVEKNSLLERMATTDELTGLPNRRFFLDSLERELRKMTRVPAGQPLSVLVIDLDRFKSINDRYGHAAGDEVLRQVARRLGQGVRATDLAARYGGEEFSILLPGTDTAGARFLAEKLRADVEGTEVRCTGTPIRVTISVGVATVEQVQRYDPAVGDDLLRRADAAMYEAKTSGRNRVAVNHAANVS